MDVLADAELDFLEFDGFSLLSNDRFGAAVALADALVEILARLDDSDSAGLLYLTVEAPQKVLG